MSDATEGPKKPESAMVKGEKTSKYVKRERIIAALLVSPSVRSAAASVGLSESTVYRLLKKKEFSEDYREARASLRHHALGRLQHAAGGAVEVLLKIAENPEAKDADRVAAATKILELAMRGTAAEDHEAQLRAIEERLALARPTGGAL